MYIQICFQIFSQHLYVHEDTSKNKCAHEMLRLAGIWVNLHESMQKLYVILYGHQFNPVPTDLTCNVWPWECHHYERPFPESRQSGDISETEVMTIFRSINKDTVVLNKLFA
jgi:hypothetical protein